MTFQYTDKDGDDVTGRAIPRADGGEHDGEAVYYLRAGGTFLTPEAVDELIADLQAFKGEPAPEPEPEPATRGWTILLVPVPRVEGEIVQAGEPPQLWDYAASEKGFDFFGINGRHQNRTTFEGRADSKEAAQAAAERCIDAEMARRAQIATYDYAPKEAA